MVQTERPFLPDILYSTSLMLCQRRRVLREAATLLQRSSLAPPIARSFAYSLAVAIPLSRRHALFLPSTRTHAPKGKWGSVERVRTSPRAFFEWPSSAVLSFFGYYSKGGGKLGTGRPFLYRVGVIRRVVKCGTRADRFSFKGHLAKPRIMHG